MRQVVLIISNNIIQFNRRGTLFGETCKLIPQSKATDDDDDDVRVRAYVLHNQKRGDNGWPNEWTYASPLMLLC